MADDADYEHWPGEELHYIGGEPAAASPLYDSQPSYKYYPYAPGQSAPVPGHPNNAIMYYPVQPPYAPQYHPYGYPYMPAYDHQTPRAPAPVAMSHAQQYYQYLGVGPGYPKTTSWSQPASRPGPNAWIGRTEAQIEEDNMRIARSQGAWDKRKVVPIMSNEQFCWVVEPEGGHTLRTFSTIKTLKGEWKPDTRYPDSWYFVREAEAKQA